MEVVLQRVDLEQGKLVSRGNFWRAFGMGCQLMIKGYNSMDERGLYGV